MRNGRTDPRCPRCGVVWHQSGNRTGHCSGCHRTFDGLGAFNRHRVDGEDGQRTCTQVEKSDHFRDTYRNGVTYWALAHTDAERARLEALREPRG